MTVSPAEATASTPNRPTTCVSWMNRAARALVAVVLLAIAGIAIVGHLEFRTAEATVMTWLLKPFLGDDVFAFRDQFVIKQDPTHYLGLQITSECSTLVLLVPTLVFLAGMLGMVNRVRWGRWALGALAGLGLIIVVNLARIAMIAGATLWFGDAGYEWSHLVVGSLVAFIGIVAAVILTLRIMTGRRRAHP